MDVQESRNDKAGLKTVAPRGTNIIDIISLEINTIIVSFYLTVVIGHSSATTMLININSPIRVVDCTSIIWYQEKHYIVHRRQSSL